MERLEILGELGTVYRHMDDFIKAGHAFDLEYKLGTQLIWQAEAEVCRAIGNAGMVKYQQAMLLQRSNLSRQRMLEEAIQDFKRRIELASSLRQRLSSLPNDCEAQRLSSKTHFWEAIGVVRLVLCYVATGQIEDALKQGERGITLCETMADPTSRAHARFYHGYALWHRGRDKDKAEAKRLFELHGPDKRDRCTPAIAFCKEPSAEYRGYLAFLIDKCTVRVDHYDESGYTALDYAIFSGDEKSEDSIIRGLTLVPAEGNESKRSTKEVTILRDEASLRKHYRVILQEHFRPAFSTGGRNLLKTVKSKYAELLNSSSDMSSALDELKYVQWSKFRKHGRLPRSDDQPNIVEIYQSSWTGDASDVQIVFISYRWIGRSSQPPVDGPDDIENTQYLRMCDAVERLLEETNVDGNRIGLWLDIACIDQQHEAAKRRGIASLPLIIAQCMSAGNTSLPTKDTHGTPVPSNELRGFEILCRQSKALATNKIGHMYGF
ncbi:hypothetical protein LTR27_012429 [Elasticomyces elasticus]|nr:hypothetical protein LTR27_012429 [Elasticomyces elasticus]